MNRFNAFILFVVSIFSLIFIFPGVISAYSPSSLSNINTLTYIENFGLFPKFGDINGDGHVDLLSGNMLYSSSKGIIFVNFGDGNSFESSPSLTIAASVNSSFFSGLDYGNVISIDDLNNDGYDDILSAAIAVDLNAGKAYIFNGSETLLGSKTVLQADSTLVGNQPGSIYYGVATTIVDANNDNEKDIIVIGYSPAYIYTYLRSNNGYNSNIPNSILAPTGTSLIFNSTLMNGDFNGDENIDLFVCSNYKNTGRCHLFIGLGTGEFVQTSEFNAKLVAYYLGNSTLEVVGDINNDGKDDFCISEYKNSEIATDQGKVYCFFGRSTFNSSYSVTEADVILNGQAEKDGFGRSMYLYDITNDGYLDLLVGAYQQYATAGSQHGKFYIYKNNNGTFLDSPWLSEIKTSGNNIYGLGVAATDVDGDGWSDIFVSQPFTTNGTGYSILNHYEISHGTPSLVLNSIATYYAVGSTTVLTGIATDSNSDYSISGVEWSGGNSPSGTWTDCTATDGAFDSTLESFSCEFGSMADGTEKRIYVRTHDQNGLFLPPNLYSATSIFEMNTREETGPSSPDVYQISQDVQNIITTNQVLTPIKDSTTGEQKVVVIIQPQTFNFNAYLSSNTVTPSLTTLPSVSVTGETVKTTIGTLTTVGDIKEIWYKAYAPTGYTNPKIISDLQTKPSIISLSYTGTYKNLKIANSLDGKVFKVLPNSVMDTKNKTVAAITKIGGYYTLVKPNNYSSQTTVLGTTTQQQESPSPVSTDNLNITNSTTDDKNTPKTNIYKYLIQIFQNLREGLKNEIM